jgi:enoyl-CoA hydratase/carnithine racemase
MNTLILRTTPLTGVVVLTLNRPDAFNALSEDMLSALQAEFDQLAQDQTARVVIIAANGRAFCAGHDLKEMRAEPSTEYYQKLFTTCSQLMVSLQKLPQPVIAQVHGTATAAGCQLVAMCDLAIAATAAKFAVSGVTLGLFCSTPAVAISRNLPRKRAMQLLLTGDFIDAHTAMSYGLVNEVVEPQDLEQTTLALAKKILSKPQAAVSLGKQLFYKQIETSLENAYELASQTMACNMMDPEALEGIQAFIDKRPPNWAFKNQE